MTDGRDNSVWIGRVRLMLQDGYGVEDIAIRLKADVQHVRNEVQILRAEGVLQTIFRKGNT